MLLSSIRLTPILLLGKTSKMDVYLEECSSHVNNGTRKKRTPVPKSKKSQNPQKPPINRTYIIHHRTGKGTNYRSANTHFRRAAHSNENNEPARFKEHTYPTGRTTRRSRLNRHGRVRFDGIRRAGLRNTNHDAAADPQNNGKRV